MEYMVRLSEQAGWCVLMQTGAGLGREERWALRGFRLLHLTPTPAEFPTAKHYTDAAPSGASSALSASSSALTRSFRSSCSN